MQKIMMIRILKLGFGGDKMSNDDILPGFSNEELLDYIASEGNYNWIEHNFLELKEKYKGNYIAVKRYKVLDSDKNKEKLIEKLKKNYGDIKYTTIAYIHEKYNWFVIG